MCTLYSLTQTCAAICLACLVLLVALESKIYTHLKIFIIIIMCMHAHDMHVDDLFYSAHMKGKRRTILGSWSTPSTFILGI